MQSHSQRPVLGLLAIGVGAAVGIALLNQRPSRSYRIAPPDSAPGRLAKHADFGDYAVVGKTVLIDKPRQELFDYWRDFSNLSSFMENIEAVKPGTNGSSIWTIAAPAGQSVEVETQVVDERAGELIAWRSVEGSSIDTEGRVAFRDAPAGRGTYVEAIVAYKPPGGELGRLIAKLFQREPNVQGRRELKRIKMLMETGEIATSRNRREAA